MKALHPGRIELDMLDRGPIDKAQPERIVQLGMLPARGDHECIRQRVGRQPTQHIDQPAALQLAQGVVAGNKTEARDLWCLTQTRLDLGHIRLHCVLRQKHTDLGGAGQPPRQRRDIVQQHISRRRQGKRNAHHQR